MFCVTIIIISGVQQGDARWFIYLTNWSFLLLTMATVGLALISIIRVSRNSIGSEAHELEKVSGQMRSVEAIDADLASPESNATAQITTTSSTWYEKIVWVLWILAANAAFVVTPSYWALIFKPPTDFMDIAVHALNSVVVLLELFTDTIPVRVLHILYVMMLAVAYALFTVIYWAAGGLNSNGDPFIYEVLDYENGDVAKATGILLAIVFIVSPIMQMILFGLYRLRCFIRSKKENVAV